MSIWLKDLRDNHYVEWIYTSDDPIESTKPAIYYLDLNGIRFLRQTEDYPEEQLRKRYTELARKRSYVDRCLLLADGCLDMEAGTVDGTEYAYSLEADYPDNEYNFIAESEFIHPSLCYLKVEEDDDGYIEMHYLVEVFGATTPRYMIRKKLKGYIAFLDSDEWENGIGGVELPIIHIACPNINELAYAKRCTRKLLQDIGQEDNEDFCVRFTMIEQIKNLGMTGGIWEDI